MKSIFTTFFLLLTVMLGGSAAEPANWRGSMTPYNVEAVPEALPDTLEPIGVVHIARHGARYMTSDKPIQYLRAAIEAQAQKHPVMDAGERFMTLLDSIDHVTGNNWGMLDSVGYDEEMAIATHLSSDMGHALRTGTIEAWSTYVPRAIMSMYAFTYRLAMLSPYLNIQTHEGPRQDPLLRFFDTDSTYVAYLDHGPWHEIYHEYEKKMVPVRPALALLGPESGLSDSELRKITMDAYNVLRSTAAAGIMVNTSQFFTEEELEACWKVSNLKHYLQRTRSRISDIPAEAARPLLDTIIADVDRVSDLRQPVRGMLYFGHAETLMPLFSLMNLPGCNAPDADIDDVWAQWSDADVVPLGANLDVEIWLDSEGTLLASTVLNGRRISPIPGGEILIPWSELRNYWLELAK